MLGGLWRPRHPSELADSGRVVREGTTLEEARAENDVLATLSPDPQGEESVIELGLGFIPGEDRLSL